MAESRKRRAETEEKENSPISEIMEEVKKIRKDFEEHKKETDKKFAEIKQYSLDHTSKELDNSMFLCETLKLIRKEIEENQEKTEKRLQNLEKKPRSHKKKAVVPEKAAPAPIPIKTEILGEWHVLDYENFEVFEAIYNKTFESFAENLIYELEDGKLKQTGGGYVNMVEGWHRYKGNELYVEGNHLKSFWTAEVNIDRYIENEKLHVVNHLHGAVFKRVYGRVF